MTKAALSFLAIITAIFNIGQISQCTPVQDAKLPSASIKSAGELNKSKRQLETFPGSGAIVPDIDDVGSDQLDIVEDKSKLVNPNAGMTEFQSLPAAIKTSNPNGEFPENHIAEEPAPSQIENNFNDEDNDDEKSGGGDNGDLHPHPLIFGSGQPIIKPGYDHETLPEDGEGDDRDRIKFPNGTIVEKDQRSKTKQKKVNTHVLSAEIMEQVYSCSEHRGKLIHLTGSKYFVDSNSLYTYQKAKRLCREQNLVMGEIEDVADFRSLEVYIQKYKSYKQGEVRNGNKFFIGLNDIKVEGLYVNSNGESISYQVFHGSQPDDNQQTEDCGAIGKESYDGPVGMSDENCSKPGHVICMFRVNSECYNESKETIENRKLFSERGLKLVVNTSERAYFVSNFQLSWKSAMNYCNDREMRLFYMDNVVTQGFFRSLIKWEGGFTQVPFPTVQYWSSGKFKATHMTAPIIWYTKAEPTASEERGVQKHNATFTWSGMYKWSVKKTRDPGGPLGYRRDLCVSFGFDSNPDPQPYIRNTNCELPCYFICSKNYDTLADEDMDDK